MTLYAAVIDTPLAAMLAAVDETGAIVHLHFGAQGTRAELADRIADEGDEIIWSDVRCQAVRQQVEEYCRGERTHFDLSVAPRGTPFQQKVWRELQSIPYGRTLSYGELARRLGRPGAARAVGRANALNPIPVVVPCHRVIGADGSLTGYGGGMEMKQRLLALEGARLL